MTAGRLYDLSASISTSQGLLFEISAGITVAQGRLFQLSAGVPAPFVVNVVSDNLLADPFDVVTITATVASGTVTLWSFSANPALTLSGTGNVRTFTAPAGLLPVDYRITATASGPSNGNGENHVDVHVYPHTEWGAWGGVWRAEKATQL